MAGKHLSAAALALACLISEAAFAERPPNVYTQEDISEIFQRCEPLNIAGFSYTYRIPYTEEFRNRFRQNVATWDVLHTENASQLEARARADRWNSHDPEGERLWTALDNCLLLTRAEQLRRPMPGQGQSQSPARENQSGAPAAGERAERTTTRQESPARRGRGEPPQVQARVVRQAGETRCMDVRALPTRWYDPDPDSRDTRVLTRVELVSSCPRRQLVEVLVSPWPFEAGRGVFTTPIIQHMGGWYRWPDASMNDPPPPLEWNYLWANNSGGGALHMPGQSFIDVLQEAAEARTIEVQLASCDATRDGPNGPQIKVLFLEGYGGTDGFQRSACPVIPQRQMTHQERELLARIFAVPRPPANENPQMTRCINRDGALDLITAEASCQSLAGDATMPPALRGSAMYNWARARLIAGDFQQAIEIGNRALAMRPTANTHYNLGLAYLRQGDHAAALGHFEAALRLDPRDGRASAMRNRAHLLVANPTLEQTWEAQETRRRAIAGGIARIASERSRCLGEANGLARSEGGGRNKSAGPTPNKLEHLIAVGLLDTFERRRERASSIRADAAGSEAARNYMACLVDVSGVQASELAGTWIVEVRWRLGEDLFREQWALSANGRWRAVSGTGLAEGAHGVWRLDGDRFVLTIVNAAATYEGAVVSPTEIRGTVLGRSFTLRRSGQPANR